MQSLRRDCIPAGWPAGGTDILRAGALPDCPRGLRPLHRRQCRQFAPCQCRCAALRCVAPHCTALHCTALLCSTGIRRHCLHSWTNPIHWRHSAPTLSAHRGSIIPVRQAAVQRLPTRPILGKSSHDPPKSSPTPHPSKRMLKGPLHDSS
jgi:hypothetical protein